MKPDKLDCALDNVILQAEHHTFDEIVDHFNAKYQLIPYHDREVYLFTNERSFGSKKHIVSFHAGFSGATPEHIYQYVLLTYCYRGTFPMTIDGEAVTLHEGDCLIADRHCPHAVDELPAGVLAVNVILNDRFFEKRMLADLNRVGSSFGLSLVTRGADHAGWQVYHAADALSRSCIDLLLCEHLDERAGSSDIIDDLCAALITHLIRSNEPDVTSPESIEKESELMGRVHEYVAQNYREGRLSALAEELGYDASYLSAYIKRACARTFKQLVNEERMRHATLMLRGSADPVYKIAQDVGISNLTQFYRRFNEYADMTPQAYRDSPLR